VAAARPDPVTEATRLKRRLRDARADLKAARAEAARLRTVLEAAGMPDGDEPPMTPDEIRHLHALFTPSPPGGPACPDCGKLHQGACGTCGGLHARQCPRVRSVEYTSQGDRVLIRRVTYWKKWDDSGITWPESLPAIPEGG